MPKQTLFYECLNSLYQDIPLKKIKSFLFPDDKLLGDIFFLKDDFNIEKFLVRLEEMTYSLNYVNTNIQIVDYLGNTDNDINVVKIGFCLLLFKEQFPLIKVNSQLQKNIISNLVKTAQPKRGEINYINSNSVLLLFLLKKVDKINVESFFTLLLQQQQGNGIWSSGFNGYLVDNASELDILHTTICLINLLEYQVYKKIAIKSPLLEKEKEININIKKPDEEIKEKEPFIGSLSKRSKHLNIIERFDNITDQSDTYFYFDLNFYNTTLILVLILVAINIPRIKSKLLKI